MSRPSATRVKRNVLVELVSRDIKEVTVYQFSVVFQFWYELLMKLSRRGLICL